MIEIVGKNFPMTQTHTIKINGPAGILETSLDIPESCTRGIAFLAHPLTVQGGNKDHKVIRILSRCLTSAGYIAVRPNLRGAGSSSGSYEAGTGEVEDFLRVIDTVFEIRGVAELLPAGGRVVFGGFSFGTYVTSLAGEIRKPAAFIFAGPAVKRFEIIPPEAPAFVVHGEMDETVPLTDALNWARTAGLPVTVIPGADHAFTGKLPLLERIISQFVALI